MEFDVVKGVKVSLLRDRRLLKSKPEVSNLIFINRKLQ